MDNEVIITIDDKVFKFKLKSQAIVTLEKVYGKNIFEIFQDLSFTSVQRILWESLINKELVKDMNELMDELMKKYTLIEMGGDLIQDIAIKSGIINGKELEDDKDIADDIKNV